MYVDAGALTSSVASGLVAEVPEIEIARAADEAGVRVSVRRAESSLGVVVVSASGALVLERQVAIERELAAAVRVVVLLVAEAIGPPLATAPERRPRFSLSAGVTGTRWDDPGTVQLGAQAGAAIDLDALQVGLQAFFTPCCSIDKPDVGFGTSFVVGLLATLELPIVRGGGFALGGVAAAGASLRAFDGEWVPGSGAPAESRSPQSYLQVEPLARAGATVRQSLGERVGLGVSFGVELRGNRRVLEVPEGYPAAGQVLDPGLFAPWVEAGVRFAIF